MLGFRVASSRRAFVAIVLSGLFACSCLSPTLPLPPPVRPIVSPADREGYSTVRGRVPGGTTAIVENLSTGNLIGKATDETGKFEIRIGASSYDRINVYYFDGLERSQSIVVLVPADGSGEGGAGGAP